MSTIRVLIADDEAVIRASLRLLVEHEPGMSVIGEAAEGRAAVELAREYRPDVVLMDVQMPRMNGLDATRSLCLEEAGPRVIVLTTFDLDEYVFEALRAGASGFLLKNSPPSEVLRAIRVAHDGEALLAPEVTRRLIDRFAGPSRGHIAESGVERLTERERETLQWIGLGRSNAEIAAALFVTQTTVRTYVSRILSKLGARDRAQLVVVAYEAGLVGTRPSG
ncbi:response regulator transcription factor [Leucobacter chromiireducens]|uniref:response regulator transcription factor n=1 Tax=Leucobacter chromiireducens TaxID=283877 RepID=UPI000F63AB3C|nr:response regulator transcription factor [Leucobacter chromiireducens]